MFEGLYGHNSASIYNSLNLQGYPDLVVLADMSPFMTLLIAEVRVMYTVMILDRTRNTTCHLNCGMRADPVLSGGTSPPCNHCLPLPQANNGSVYGGW